jgi:hypothetical protein
VEILESVLSSPNPKPVFQSVKSLDKARHEIQGKSCGLRSFFGLFQFYGHSGSRVCQLARAGAIKGPERSPEGRERMNTGAAFGNRSKQNLIGAIRVSPV